MIQIENYSIESLIQGFNIYHENLIVNWLKNMNYWGMGNIKLPNSDFINYAIPCYLSHIVYKYYLKNSSRASLISLCGNTVDEVDKGIFYLYLTKAGIRFNDYESYEEYTDSLITKNKDVLNQLLEKIKTEFFYPKGFLTSLMERNIEQLGGSIFGIKINVTEKNASSITKQEIFDKMKFKIEDNRNLLNYCFAVVPVVLNASNLEPILLDDTPLYINKLK